MEKAPFYSQQCNSIDRVMYASRHLHQNKSGFISKSDKKAQLTQELRVTAVRV